MIRGKRQKFPLPTSLSRPRRCLWPIIVGLQFCRPRHWCLFWRGDIFCKSAENLSQIIILSPCSSPSYELWILNTACINNTANSWCASFKGPSRCCTVELKGCKECFQSLVEHQTATVISVDLHPVQFYTKTDDLLVATFLCKKLVRTHNLVPHSEGLCLHPVQEPQKEPNAFHSSHGATHQGASKRLIFSWKSFSFLFCTALLLSRL